MSCGVSALRKAIAQQSAEPDAGRQRGASRMLSVRRGLAVALGIRKMAHLDRSVATLRIAGDDLKPAEISTLLGHAASKEQVKGEVFVGKVTGRSRTAKTGLWLLEATDATPEDLDGQIAELLGKLTGNLSVWAEIATKYEIDLFCGLFMKVSNEGLSISAASLKALGERGIELSLDIYDPDEPEDKENA